MCAASISPAGDPDGEATTDALLRALADPQRRQILQLVRGAELPAGEIARTLEGSQQGVSHHLQVLRRAGLVHERRDGTRRLYALDPTALDHVREALTELWPSALDRLKEAVEAEQARSSEGDSR